MRICILCEDSKIAQVREKEKKSDILLVPLSENGQEPVTHWFCSMVGEDSKMQKILDKQELTIMESNIDPKDFLKKHNLKFVKK